MDAHRLRQFPDGYPGAGTHQFQGLLRPLTGAPWAATASATSLPRARPAVADAGECGGRLLKPVMLLHQWAELLQPRLDLPALLI